MAGAPFVAGTASRGSVVGGLGEMAGALPSRGPWGVGGSRSLGEEFPDDAEELVEPVVVEPVAGPLHADDGGVREVAGTAVLGGVAGPALGTVEEQRRAGDA